MKDYHFGAILKCIVDELADDKYPGERDAISQLLMGIEKWADENLPIIGTKGHGLTKNSYYKAIHRSEISTGWIKALYHVHNIPPARWFEAHFFYGKNEVKAISRHQMAEMLGGVDPLVAKIEALEKELGK